MPPFQIRLRSPLVETEEIADSSCAVGNVDGLEEDVNLILFTPFKIAIVVFLSELILAERS